MPQSSVPSRNARRAYAKIAQAPIERLVVIFERFFLHEPELMAELLGELARCDTAGRRRLSPTCPRWTRCRPTGPRADLCPPSLSTPPCIGKARQAVGRHAASGNPPEPRWDSNGYRISPKLPKQLSAAGALSRWPAQGRGKPTLALVAYANRPPQRPGVDQNCND
jgi:hypothetical protein